MLERVAIRNWQSLKRLDLDLGRFTVIVGPSSSGKTAFMKALHALASNVRGSRCITRGETSTAITVQTAANLITFERSETSGSYCILDRVSGIEQRFTKCAGSVPQQVTAALGITPGSALSFAGQFDKPYLLDDSGASVARELGELTNVTIIFGAVREANRRRNSFASTLKVRESDLAALKTQLEAFRALPERLALCADAEALASELTAKQQRLVQCRTTVARLAEAEGVLARTPLVAPMPSIDALLRAQTRRERYLAVLQSWRDAHNSRVAANAAAEQAQVQETALHQQLHEVLMSAGTCPTCQQPIRA